ncbi:hypothetical protein PROFUN_15763 [Planoprotostelium fungivorum]|uniref:Uncharacterized protein n=1 Tax=Planoprotostelium fungivorum TaxID=1890364 RepID=A0A2P6MZS9_9EUKA|nr:hypothetical protein PROFUN_15763 [Planoprotostelium fungivorum]
MNYIQIHSPQPLMYSTSPAPVRESALTFELTPRDNRSIDLISTQLLSNSRENKVDDVRLSNGVSHLFKMPSLCHRGASEQEKRHSPLRGRVTCKKGDRGTLYPYGTHRSQRRQHLKSIPKHPLGSTMPPKSTSFVILH